MKCVWPHQGVFLPHMQCSRGWLQIHRDRDQDNRSYWRSINERIQASRSITPRLPHNMIRFQFLRQWFIIWWYHWICYDTIWFDLVAFDQYVTKNSSEPVVGILLICEWCWNRYFKHQSSGWTTLLTDLHIRLNIWPPHHTSFVQGSNGQLILYKWDYTKSILISFQIKFG